MNIPASLVAAYRSLPWDDRGLLNEIPAGGNLTWANSHTDLGNPYGQPIDQHGPDTPYGAFGKVMLHAAEIPSAWAIEAIPPPGTAVWQIKGQHMHIVRTSEIESHMRGGFVLARLRATGPYPGIPIGGDSGSICFVRHRGRWQVLGICNLAGTCSLPFWDLSLPTNKGSTIPPRNNEANDHESWSKAFYEPDETIVPLMNELIIHPCPTTRRVVGVYTQADDGTDNICLDILEHPGPITKLEIRGLGTDKWAWPDNGHNWIIRAGRLPDGCLRLWFKESTPTSLYTVWVNGNQTTSVLVNDEPSDPTPATNDERQYLLDKIAALEALNAKQAALILRVKEAFAELMK